MARIVDRADLRNREQRLELAIRKKPYWTALSEGEHLGYYRGRRVRKWLARFREPGGPYHYQEATIAEADDHINADGAKILNFMQAQIAAFNWFKSVKQHGE